MKRILFIDGLVNILLGLLLLLALPFPGLVDLLGVPPLGVGFYGTVLGAVLAGIGLALLVEVWRGTSGLTGLGLGGAVAINVCGAVALLAWLLFGGLELPLRGQLFLWLLVGALIGISGLELLAQGEPSGLG